MQMERLQDGAVSPFNRRMVSIISMTGHWNRVVKMVNIIDIQEYRRKWAARTRIQFNDFTRTGPVSEIVFKIVGRRASLRLCEAT
jgi:hypothetical protein